MLVKPFYIIVDFFDMIFNPAYYLALTIKKNKGKKRGSYNKKK